MISETGRSFTTNQPPRTTAYFRMRFSSTRRGARLARLLCGERLAAWGVPYGSGDHDALTLLAAELCANAIQHGHVPGRDFRLDLTAEPGPEDGTTRVRVAVTDTRGERLPEPAAPDAPDDRLGGRGLLLVDMLGDRWGCAPRPDGPGKTVWSERVVPGALRAP